MPRRTTRLTPRKLPRQDRARATVDAILDAATYILRRTSADAMTTNQIAARAGVNIASLYQYFPNKQSIIAALLQRHVDQTRAAIVPVLARRRTVAARIRGLVEVMAAVHAIDPTLHERLTTLGPQLGLPPVHTETDATLAAASAAWIQSMQGRLPDPSLALWVAQTAVHAVFHLAFTQRPHVAASPALVDELVRLITPYLTPRRTPRSKARAGAKPRGAFPPRELRRP